MASPFHSPPFFKFWVSLLGIIPKKEPNSFRLVHYLSYPYGLSINYEIDPPLSTVSYSLFDDALVKIRNLCGSALLDKADIKLALWLLPIHSTTFTSLDFHFTGQFYFIRDGMFATLKCSLHSLNWMVGFQSFYKTIALFARFSVRRFARFWWILLCVTEVGFTYYLFGVFGCYYWHWFDVISSSTGEGLQTPFLGWFFLSKCKVTMKILQFRLGLFIFASKVIP